VIGIVDTNQRRGEKMHTMHLKTIHLPKKENQTELKVDMQVDTNYKAMFEEMWPRALKTLKDLSEK
jgi:hypothetical protein